ncbi:MAG: ATP-dependent DNA ligase, partial [Planctomycetales bacterium]|nr:ATP-dependent DNA ligase [Planctomycetales bacterium]
MQLKELTAAANAVAATRSRKQKIATLAACLARMDPEEIQTGASYLMGLLPGGPVGLGPAAVSGLGGVEAASTSVLDLNEVQGAL